jgi:hypothetical protein
VKMKPTLPARVSYDARVFPNYWRLTFDVGEQTLILREVCDETLDGTSDHSVLTHQDDSMATQRLPDFVHLRNRQNLLANIEWAR